MNEGFYKTQGDWNGIINKKLKEKGCDNDFVVIPVNNNVKSSLSKIPSDVDSVFVTPLFNLSTDERKELYSILNSKKLPSFSGLGREDVNLGALLGTSTRDLDKKLAEATSFNIHGVLHGNKAKAEKIAFYDDEIIFYNSDTGEILDYAAPLRLLNNCEVISHKPITKYDLTYIMNTLEEQNLDIARKKQLINAARRATTAAYLKYLPTLRIDLGYQAYNKDYAYSYSDVPDHGLHARGQPDADHQSTHSLCPLRQDFHHVRPAECLYLHRFRCIHLWICMAVRPVRVVLHHRFLGGNGGRGDASLSVPDKEVEEVYGMICEK